MAKVDGHFVVLVVFDINNLCFLTIYHVFFFFI